jgi:hypothetical protein
MSAYAGIKEVTPARKQAGETQWLTPGKYTLEIAAVRDGVSNRGMGQPYFAVDFEVLAEIDSEYEIGDTVTWMTKRGKYENYFLQDVQNFICAATKSPASQVDQSVVETCVGEDQPLVGEKLRANVFTVAKDRNGETKEFTEVEFKPLRD